MLRALGGDAAFFELGGGSGAFAADAAAGAGDAAMRCPRSYRLLEPSADLRERQRERLRERLPPELFARCRWLDGPPEAEWRGVLFANEVLDALPTPRFVIREGEVYEEHVVLDADGGFLRVDQPADALLRAAVRHVERDIERQLPEGYRSEMLPQLPYWIQAVGGLLREGAMLFVDYGYPRGEYYLPERSDGTLRLPLPPPRARRSLLPARPAGPHRVRGFHRAGRSRRQRRLRLRRLLHAGQLPARQRAASSTCEEIDAIADDAERYRRHQEIKRLTLPGEMGERFQVMGFQRGVDFRASFAAGDLSRRL